MPQPEAKRRFVQHEGWQQDGEGLCQDCEAQRHVALRGWCEGAGELGSLVHGFADEIDAVLDQHLRVVQRLAAPGRELVVLVPLEPTRTQFVLAWQNGPAMSLAEFQGLDGLLEAIGAGTVSTVDADGNATGCADDPAATLAWARGLWAAEDLDRRVRFVVERARFSGELGSVADLALAEEVSRCAPICQASASDALAAAAALGGVGLGAVLAKALGASKRTALAGAGVAGGLAGLALAIALTEDDSPLTAYQSAIRATVSWPQGNRLSALDDAVNTLFTTRPDQFAGGVGDEIVESWRSAALVGRWLHNGRAGALTDAAESRAANPWAVALAAAVGSREPLRAAVASGSDVNLASFPWPTFFQRLLDALTEAGHWTNRTLGGLTLRGRCGVGATKEVWQLSDRPSEVVCVARPGRERALEGEVDLLRSVGEHYGAGIREMGLPEVIDCGRTKVEGRDTVGYVTQAGEPFVNNQSQRIQTTTDVVRVVRAVARTLGALHSAGYVHGDVKPDNLLWGANDQLILCDFDSATRLGQDGFGMSLRSTPLFAAPEQAAGRAYPGSDVYALGRLAEGLLSQVRDRPSRQDLAPGPRKLIDLLDQCTLQAPERRPTARQVESGLDAWLSGPRAVLTRLSTAEIEAQRRFDQARAGWRRQPVEPVERALLAAIESLFVLMHRAESDGARIRAVARNLVDAAQKAVIVGFLLPWADAARHGGAERLGKLTVILRNKERQANRRTTAERIGVIIGALEGRTELDLSLARLPSLLTGYYHEELQDEWRLWLHEAGAVPNLDRLAARCRGLGRLRNDLHHDASQGGERVYGTVVGNALALRVDDVVRIERDVVELTGWLHGAD